jgi:hypothetical protein
MARAPLATVAACAAFFSGVAVSSAQQPVGPYDGSNPFRCQLQDVGTGTDFPDPDADPFCVKFDKTNQNVTDFGLVDFLLQEPSRVAGAVTKCFYFQRDHWTGSVVQGAGPELWNWKGNYWFDRARGLGGVSVREFRVAGQPADMTPFVPAEYKPYFDGAGGGGVQVTLATDPDPVCGQLVDTPEEREQIYRNDPVTKECVPPGGRLRGRKVGRVKLGMDRAEVLARLGEPTARRKRVDRWCVVGAASLRIAYKRKAVSLIRTSSRGHELAGVAPKDRKRRAQERFGAPEFRVGKSQIVRGGDTTRRQGFAALGNHRVRWVAIADASANAKHTLNRTR